MAGKYLKRHDLFYPYTVYSNLRIEYASSDSKINSEINTSKF